MYWRLQVARRLFSVGGDAFGKQWIGCWRSKRVHKPELLAFLTLNRPASLKARISEKQRQEYGRWVAESVRQISCSEHRALAIETAARCSRCSGSLCNCSAGAHLKANAFLAL